MRQRLDWPGVLAAALGLALALPILTYPLGRDQGMYANIAQAIRAGGVAFIDMWDIKPPAIYYIYAAGMSVLGATPVALRAIDLIATPLTLLALYQLTAAFAGQRAARWAMLLYPVFYFTETFASLTQSDSLVTLPMTWAALCALRGMQSSPGTRRALSWAFACGALCALVMWFKHYYLLFAVALAAAHVWTRIKGHGPQRTLSAQGDTARFSPKRLALEAAAFAAGGLSIGVPSLLYFASSGMLDEMLAVARGTSGYTAQSFSSLTAFWAQMENYVRFRWWHWGPLLILAVGFWLSAFGEKQHVQKQSTSPSAAAQVPADVNVFPSALLSLWLLAGVVFVVMQGKGFDTHWLPLLPPLVMIGSAALDRWLGRAARWTGIERVRVWSGGRLLATGAQLLAACAVVLFAGILAKDTWARAWPYLTGEQSLRAYWNGFQAGDLNAGDSLRMARWLEARTEHGDSVYIWGFRPEVAFLAGLRPATRFQAQFALVGDRYPEQWKQENVDALWAALPTYVLVVRADHMPWVTGTEKDSNEILAQDYHALRDWLIENYDRHEEIGNFLTWKRKERT